MLQSTWSQPKTLIFFRRDIIAKNQNTFAKRQREADKKAKAEAKRVRRNNIKQGIEVRPPYQQDREPGIHNEPEDESSP
ncbi:hypothetical protein [Gimesia sp.]|uniref:hypothetical protein n=1 Tax=Gimesia sp. TaxID=2024833 RepID=UPI003A9171DB